jgi:hypothetical protein
MNAPTFEEVRQRTYDVLAKVQEKLRSDWLYDDQGPSHEQVEALHEARKHVAAARAALLKAARVPGSVVPEQVAHTELRLGGVEAEEAGADVPVGAGNVADRRPGQRRRFTGRPLRTASFDEQASGGQ